MESRLGGGSRHLGVGPLVGQLAVCCLRLSCNCYPPFVTSLTVPVLSLRPSIAELGSAASSPSKAGSLVPLLRSAPSARSGLLKFPSGVSAVSSHDNPVYEDALWGAAPTQQSVLPQHVGSWELQSQVFTQQAMAQAQAAAAAAVAAAQHQQQQQQQGEEDEWRPDVLAMMERKGATGGCAVAVDLAWLWNDGRPAEDLSGSCMQGALPRIASACPALQPSASKLSSSPFLLPQPPPCW